MMTDFNRMTPGDDLSAYWAFDLAPVRDFGRAGLGACFGESDLGIATPSTAEVWTVYGRLPDGEAVALHDAPTIGEAVARLRAAHLTGRQDVAYSDEDWFVAGADLPTLARALRRGADARAARAAREGEAVRDDGLHPVIAALAS